MLESTDKDDISQWPAVALQEGKDSEVVVNMSGNTFRVGDNNDYIITAKTGAKAEGFIERITNKIEHISTESLERDIAEETASEIFEISMDILADIGGTLQQAAQQAVEQALNNHPAVLDAITHPNASELVVFVVKALKELFEP